MQIVAISYDPATVLKRFADKRGIAFPLLSDPDSRVIDAFGIRNREAGGRALGVPHPGTFLLDVGGVIRARLFHDGYQRRHTSADLVREAQALR